jgi:hypothetical protein
MSVPPKLYYFHIRHRVDSPEGSEHTYVRYMDHAIVQDERDKLWDLLRDIETAAKPPGTDVGWSDPPWSDLYDRIWAEVHGPKPEPAITVWGEVASGRARDQTEDRHGKE